MNEQTKITIPLNTLLEFIWQFKDRSLKPFEVVEREMANLIQTNDPNEVYCHCENITNNEVKVWRIQEWRNEYFNVLKRRFEGEVERRIDNAKEYRLNAILKGMAKKFNIQEGKDAILLPLANELAKKSNIEIKDVLYASAGIEIKDLDDIKSKEEWEQIILKEGKLEQPTPIIDSKNVVGMLQDKRKWIEESK